ncbi:MAG TPA: GUN4 domain-containing protein [Candidatus Sericytochromatia bacterium]
MSSPNKPTQYDAVLGGQLRTHNMPRLGTFFLIEPQNWLFKSHPDVKKARTQANHYKIANNTLNGAEYQIKEFIRQWVIRQLIDLYHYPIQWIEEQINIEYPVQVGFKKGKVDISIINDLQQQLIYIETKRRGISDREFKSTEEQLKSYLSATKLAKIGIVTDGERTVCISKYLNDFKNIPDIPLCGTDSSVEVQPSQYSLEKDWQLPPDADKNYTNLRESLANGMWKEADRETGRIMLEVAEREKDLDNESIENFPCHVLHTIDQLWLEYSGGRFGFSVQKRIYEEIGEDYIDFQDFASHVGWRQGDRYNEKFGKNDYKTRIISYHLNYRIVYPSSPCAPTGMPLPENASESAQSCPFGYLPSLRMVAKPNPSNRRNWFYTLEIGEGIAGGVFYDTHNTLYCETGCLKNLFNRIKVCTFNSAKY